MKNSPLTAEFFHVVRKKGGWTKRHN